MKLEFWKVRAMAILAAASLLAACGGGSGGGDGGSSPDTVLTGVAAEGAPMAGAQVQLVDSLGNVVAQATTNDDGSYTLTVPATAQAPFVASASTEDLVYYSPVAENRTGTINITKITNLIAAQLSPTGDPSDLASQIAAGTASVTAQTVSEVVAAIVEALAPLLANVGDSVNPLTGTFSADGSGHDQVLKSLDIAILPTGTSANITITVKAVTALNEQPPAITFTSGSKPPPLPQAVATAELPSSDSDAQIAAFIARMEACYALPLAERVSGSSVIAPTCKQIFSQNDPATFKQNGSTVGPSGAFSGLFRSGATGVKFSNPTIEFLNPGGKLLVSWKNVDTSGGANYSRVWVVHEDGALKAIGNQATYPFNVRPWSEYRELLNTPTLSYWATGYDAGLPNITNGGTPIFDRVILTTPNGRALTLQPNGGLSFLTIAGSNTSVVRLAGKFANASVTAQPRTLSESIFWAANPNSQDTDWTEAEISAIRNVGRWKAEFFLAGNTGSTPDATQYHETTTRPLTIGELTQRSWAGLQPAAKQELISGSSATGYIQMNEGDRADLSVEGDTDFWQVPAGALPPTFAQVQGMTATTPVTRFNDNTNISSIVRKVVINCSPQSVSDPHCGSTSETYSAVSRINFLQLMAFDQKDMNWVSSFGLYKPAFE